MNWMIQRPSWPACVTGAVMAILAGSDWVTGAVMAIFFSPRFLPKM